MMKKSLLIILLLAATLPALNAQQPPASSDKSQLEKERQDIQDELKQIQSMYDKVKGQKTQSLGQLNMLKRKINLQERYINSINKELKMIDDDIYTGNLEIYRLQKQVDTLKAQYARTIVYAYKNRSSYDYVNFIFSASSFNDAIRRIAYLKNYRAYREKQVNTILETQQLIARRQQLQLSKKEQKSVALQNQTKEKSALDEQRKEKDEVVSKLKSQEKDLQKQIAVKKKRDRDLQNAIFAIVKRDIAAAKKAEEEKNKNAAVSPAVKPSAPNSSSAVTAPEKKPASYLELNATDVKLGSDFANSRGKLPWPVDKGFISIPFGIYTIDGTTIKGNNPGITIATPSAGIPVKAVFDGIVSAVDNRGELATVFIRHGKYYTVYSNLSGINVTKGATVRTGEVIGKVGEAYEGSGGELNFVLMIESNNVNPQIWLHR
ncbi:MAG: peptidoglycan DD-metalloendopeptidase family protein [Bacteroidota bacterium]|nr:peptidoglycan DD-metalloendopeptidase family protein [Bacteroidota bacterium]